MPRGVIAIELQIEIASAYAKARQLWPAFDVSEQFFFERFLETLSDLEGAAAALSVFCGGDFYLACACVLSQSTALKELDRIVASIRPALAQVLRNEASIDDAAQILRRKLMTTLDGPARIASYSGRGPLRRWVRAVATRVAFDLKRSLSDRHQLMGSGLSQLASVFSDPEMSIISRRDRPRFEAAFARALATLGARERHALRLHVVEGQSFEAIGSFYGVAKSTVSRWISAARHDVLVQLRKSLRKEMNLRGQELESFIDHLRGRLDLSISQLLVRED